MYCVELSPGLDPNAVGTKAANLGRLMELGQKVPPGFAITREALNGFLLETGLLDTVRGYLSTNESLSRDTREKEYRDLCTRVEEVSLPEQLERDVSKWSERYLQQAPAGLAVRSSSINEDADEASFAGLFESFLGLTSAEEIYRQVRQCWCAAWTPGVIDYARKMEVELVPDHLAVIVQPMVQADRSGVLFTADPLTGNPWTFAIDSTFGLARDLVGGNLPGDQFLLEWDTGRAVEKNVVAKARMISVSREGVREIDIPPDRKNIPSLTDEQAGEIGRIGLEVDRAFGCRVDLEWAIEGEEIFLVQARPITALPDFFPHNLEGKDAKLTWSLTSPDPVTPLFRDLWDSQAWVQYKPEGVALGHLEYEERDINGYRYATESVWRDWQGSMAELEAWLDAHETEHRREWEVNKQEMQETTRRAARAQEEEQSTTELISTLLEMQRCMAELEPMNLGPSQSLGWLCEDLLEWFAKERVPDFDRAMLLQGIATYSHERTVAIQELGQSIDEPFVQRVFSEFPLDQVLPYLLKHHPACHFLRAYEAFCWRFGSRLPAWESRPVWWKQAGELEPHQTLFAVKKTLSESTPDVREVRRETIRKREGYAEEIRRTLRKSDPSLVSRFDKILAWTQYWVPLLDDRQWYCPGNIRLSELIWETGVKLQSEGIIENPGDVLLLTPDDLKEIGRSTALQEKRDLRVKRKREWERNRRLHPPKHLGALLEKSEKKQKSAQAPREEAPGKVFKGRGYTPGRVSGIARKVVDMANVEMLDSLTDDHILVCTPEAFDGIADWLSLLIAVKGLVSVNGPDRLHHAIQLARECGVVMVNLKGLNPEQIPDGVPLEIDGNAGTVTLLEERLNPSH
jgi:hypothetical protein